MKKEFLAALILGLLYFSCSNDSESDLIDQDQNPIDVISYKNNIQQIIDNNCLNCHSNPPVNGAPFALDTYERVRNRIEDGNLLSVINLQAGQGGAMPPSGRMPQATINLIEKWAEEGFLEQ